MDNKYELKMDEYQKKGKEKYSDNYIEEAEKHTLNNYREIMQSGKCRCMHCGYSFKPAEELKDLKKNSEKAEGRNIHCTKCFCDSVIGDMSGLPINDIYFIARCTREWFSSYSRLDYIGFSSEKIKWTRIEVE